MIAANFSVNSKTVNSTAPVPSLQLHVSRPREPQNPRAVVHRLVATHQGGDADEGGLERSLRVVVAERHRLSADPVHGTTATERGVPSMVIRLSTLTAILVSVLSSPADFERAGLA